MSKARIEWQARHEEVLRELARRFPQRKVTAKQFWGLVEDRAQAGFAEMAAMVSVESDLEELGKDWDLADDDEATNGHQ